MRIQTFSSFDGIDRDKFRELLEHRFKGLLISDYFEYAKPNLVCVAASEEREDRYAGAIVMENFCNDLWYLDKMVVAEEFDRTLLFLNLWKRVAEKNKVVWRARPDNPANRFYINHSLSMSSHEGWRIYCMGLGEEERRVGVLYAAIKKPSFLVFPDAALASDTGSNRGSAVTSR